MLAQEEVQMIRIRPLKKKTGLSSTAIWEKSNTNSKRYDPEFPKPVSLGPRTTAWVLSEIDAWLKSKIAARETVVNKAAA